MHKYSIILRALYIASFLLLLSLGVVSNPVETIPVEDSLELVVSNSEDLLTLVESYSQLCWLKRSREPEKAILYGNKALQIISKNPDLDYLKAQTLNYLGVVNRNKGDYSYAMNYYFEALKNAEKYENNAQIAYSNNNLGGIFTLKGDYLDAISYLQKALRYFSKENDLAGMGYVSVNLGNLYRHTNDFEEGIKYFEQAIEYKEEINDSIGIAIAMNLKAIVLYKLERYDEAKKLYQQLRHVYEHNQDKKGLAVINNYLGSIEVLNGNYQSAINYFKTALKINTEIGYKQGIASVRINMAMAYHYIGNTKEGFRQLGIGYDLARETGDLEVLKDSYKNYAELYYQLKNYLKAYEYQIKYQETLEKYNNHVTQERIASLRINNEIEKKKSRTEHLENQNKLLEENVRLDDEKIKFQEYIVYLLIVIIILILIPLIVLIRKNRNKHSHNEDLQEKNSQLQIANQTRERFLSIIGHDLKNPFNSVLGLTSFLVEEWESLPEEEKRNIINEIHASENTIYELMDNLLLWAKNQNETIELHQERFDMNEYVIEVYEIFRNQASFKEIKIELNIGSSNFVFADPNMISTVLRNLLSNAIKFTRKGGKVVIDVKKLATELEFSISDNGKGIPPDDLKRMLDEQSNYSSKGTANETGTGLGLLVVQDFVKKNNGVFWVESKVGVGSKFCFTLPDKLIK